MEDEYIYNVKAKVRLAKPQGYGFLSFAEENQPHEDIYFHISQITNKEMKWEDVKTGMNVMIDCLTRSAKGFSAVSVTFIRPKK